MTVDENRYLIAISRRNTAWARWQGALALLASARQRGVADPRLYISHVNEAQYDHEHAARDLVRARGWWRAQRGGAA